MVINRQQDRQRGACILRGKKNLQITDIYAIIIHPVCIGTDHMIWQRKSFPEI